MIKLVHIVCVGVLLLGAAALPAAAQGRGDHDTPATQRRAELAEQRYYDRACRSEGGWAVCRDRDGDWRRDRAHPRFGWPWANDRRHRNHGWFWERPRMLDGNVVARQLHRWGFEDLRDMKLRGDVYSAKAIDPYGRRVIVSVDPYTGRIVDVVPR
jgi:hypothetical protein